MCVSNMFVFPHCFFVCMLTKMKENRNEVNGGTYFHRTGFCSGLIN